MRELDLAGKLAVAGNIVESGVLSVNLGGGEPLLCADAPRIVERLASENVLVELTTSGWGTTPERVHELADAGLKIAYLSIDDIRPDRHDALRGQPGCYEACLRAARLYRDAGIGLVCSTVVTSANFEVLEDLVLLAVHFGCSGIELKRLRLQGNACSRHDLELSDAQVEELYRRVAAWKRRYPLDIVFIYGARAVPGIDEGCPCGRTVLAILPNGDVAPCVYRPYAIGNATRDRLDVLWTESPELARMRASGACASLEGAFEDVL